LKKQHYQEAATKTATLNSHVSSTQSAAVSEISAQTAAVVATEVAAAKTRESNATTSPKKQTQTTRH
jgi:hypothetical protein